MKHTKALKTSAIVLLIILITMISFVGVYTKEKNQMVNRIPDYQLGRNIKGKRLVKINPSEATQYVIKDKDGKVIETVASADDLEQKGYTEDSLKEKEYTKTEELVNAKENLTQENYEFVKSIVEKRLVDAGSDDYLVRLDKETGDITIELAEDSKTDIIINNLTTVGKLELKDEQTGEVLLDNNSIKECKVGYVNQSSTSTGTSVVLQIKFNKEGAKKLEEISKNYTKTTDEEGNETEKDVTLSIDGSKIVTTYFSEPITDGILPLTMGQSATDETTIQNNAIQAGSVAMVLNNGKMPITYTVDQNEYIASSITKDMLKLVAYIALGIILVGSVIFIIRYKKTGILAAISYIGLIGLFLLVIRYTNVILTIEGLFGIAMIAILAYIAMNQIAKKVKESRDRKADKEQISKEIKENLTSFFMAIVPICIVVIAFCFMRWTPLASFGMVMFWGFVIIAIYNILITKTLLSIQADDE